MPKHSPAPWTATVRKDGQFLYSPHAVIADADGNYLGTVHLLPPGYGLDPARMAAKEANVPLIEAAPALLAALKYALEWLEGRGFTSLVVAHVLRRAIAEAEGVSGE